ncbi:hypothetical protein YDYSG_36610 [Paenibacillus tyrfis]|nr:hypothetical protein YDYSG_36610 [Paenibacillus tyrfis]
MINAIGALETKTLKRKYGDRAEWKRVVERRCAQSYLETESYKGHVTLLEIYKVTEP